MSPFEPHSGNGEPRYWLPKKVSERLWLLIQALAMAAAIITPVLFKISQSPTPGEDENSLRSRAPANIPQIQKTSIMELVSSKGGGITSRVVTLPDPEHAPRASEIEVETRQLRLERPTLAPRNGRQPAAADWRLSSIRRVGSGTSEELPLIYGENAEALGSSFIELENGSNEFQVSYKKGRDLRTLTLRVRFKENLE